MNRYSSASLWLNSVDRPDTLDPALLRPGRLDRRVEFSLPDVEGRAHILRIHARSMSCERDIRFDLIARLCPNTTGAELRSVATEAGMFAIRARRKVATERDFLDAVEKVVRQGTKFSSTYVFSPMSLRGAVSNLSFVGLCTRFTTSCRVVLIQLSLCMHFVFVLGPPCFCQRESVSEVRDEATTTPRVMLQLGRLLDLRHRRAMSCSHAAITTFFTPTHCVDYTVFTALTNLC